MSWLTESHGTKIDNYCVTLYPGGTPRKAGWGYAHHCHILLPPLWPKSAIFATLFLIWQKIWYPIYELWSSHSYASINSSGAHSPPPGQPRGICSNVSPGGGALAILSQCDYHITTIDREKYKWSSKSHNWNTVHEQSTHLFEVSIGSTELLSPARIYTVKPQ